MFDHFDGAAGSRVNTSIWNYGEFHDLNRWDAKVRDTNAVLMGDSTVKLTITQANNGYGAELSSGWLESNYQFGPGTICEWYGVLNPAGYGAGHSTFWTNTLNGMNGTGGTGDGAEIDCREFAPGIGYQSNVIYGGYPGTAGANAYAIPSGSAAAWEVFSVEWQASQYIFRRNGVIYHTFNAFVATNTDQRLRCVIEHDYGAAPEAAMFVDYAGIWVPS